ncbi:hypothetical protein QBC36DRAFT_199072 [Triangularia setosa]|uniref:Heme oxygenase n=1 Tax=Triangularia setosa TaxID=2587417 RepID=A0AAN7A325_9PEZI|nr:hypothetical protein QBC36DRAFT_199072 [Podospora setosa]
MSTSANPTPTLPLPHLGDSINTATRPQHTKLNKSILLRLPLSVPPRACNPTAYLTGLLHIAPIYIAFESAWDKILASHEAALDSSSPSTSLLVPENQSLPLLPFGTADPLEGKGAKCERVHTILQYLKIEGLSRSGSLRTDMRAMSGWSEEELEAQLEAVQQTGRLGEFVKHVHGNIGKQPEVVVAYAWVLYMALFSGGRFLASCLEAAGAAGGEGFWSKRCDSVLGKPCHEPISIRELLGDGDGDRGIKDDGLPLSFFRFATPLDGEEIKTKFKTRLLELEGLLTGAEREHVTREGVCIFDVMQGVVGQLDGVFEKVDEEDGGEEEEEGGMDDDDGWASMLVPRGAVGRLRDSVAVAKERGMRALRKATFSGGEGSRRRSSGLAGEGYGGGRYRRKSSSGGLESLVSVGSSAAAKETSTSGLHAHGTITSATELVEKASLGRAKSPVMEGDSSVRVVRFGEENALLQQQRKGAKSVTIKTEAVQQQDASWTPPPPPPPPKFGECPLTRVGQKKRREVSAARGAVTRRQEVKNRHPSTFWSLVLLVALVGFGWGYGYGYITGWW